jgi:thiamine biosynthesis lipoprotein
VVHRAAPFRFDLDGVAKGWIADRALWLLRRYPAALVDADGDVAVRAAADTTWLIGVADPRAAGEDLVRLAVPHGRRGSPVGIATSGTHVHRWSTRPDGAPRHHLIDPRTGAPAATDVVQATVVASTARAAEALAKAVVVAGSEAGADLLARSGAMAAVILLASGEVIATPSTLDWAA